MLRYKSWRLNAVPCELGIKRWANDEEPNDKITRESKYSELPVVNALVVGEGSDGRGVSGLDLETRSTRKSVELIYFESTSDRRQGIGMALRGKSAVKVRQSVAQV